MANNVQSLLEQAEQFLRGQEQLFGGTLYPEFRNHAEPQIHEEEAVVAVKREIIEDIQEVLQEEILEEKKGVANTQLMPAEPLETVLQAPTDTIFTETTTILSPMKTSSVASDWQQASSLDALYGDIHTCMNCKLGALRKRFVFGVGNPNADIMVIGEAPGADEDEQGEPFVGRAGQLLTKILEAIHFKREDVYIANIIKCRPPENRRPHTDEVEQCEPYLHKQIALIKPKFILALGLTAVNTLLKSNHKMGDIRGKLLTYQGTTMIATYHPAALLRNPEWKRGTWEDVQLLRRMYDESKATGQ